MGILVDALRLVVPERKTAVGAAIPTWDAGVPQYPRNPYVQLSRAYEQNEIVFAAIEELASSAAEPCIAAYRKTADEPERLETTAVLDLFERPNPFTTKYDLIAGIIMFLHLSGNVFVEKVRSRAGNVVELWLLRPDRIRVIPDRDQFVRGYLYEIGAQKYTLPTADVIHIRTRNPGADGRGDYYGMPPLAVCLPRVEADVAMRSFAGAFFRNAGVPAGLLNIKRSVNSTEREMIRSRFRQETGGVNAHSLLVLDETDATYTPMGMALGERGLVYPEMDEIAETRIAMPFGVPLELIGARLGMIHGNRTTNKEARAGFWDETLSPLYVMLANVLTNGLVDDFTGWDYLEFDTSTVKALQEDTNAKHERVRADAAAGLLTQAEAREELGYDPDPPPDGLWMLGAGITPTNVGEEVPEPEPMPVALDPNAPPDPNTPPQPPVSGAKTVKRPVGITPADVVKAKAWIASLDDPELDAALNGRGRNGRR